MAKRPVQKYDFTPFGKAIKSARNEQKESRNKVGNEMFLSPRYLANIELEQTIPSLPVIIQLVKICGLPMERYFNPEVMREESKLRQRVSHKLALCPEKYLPIVEATIDGAIKMNE